jgi:hypothetical protein
MFSHFEEKSWCVAYTTRGFGCSVFQRQHHASIPRVSIWKLSSTVSFSISATWKAVASTHRLKVSPEALVQRDRNPAVKRRLCRLNKLAWRVEGKTSISRETKPYRRSNRPSANSDQSLWVQKPGINPNNILPPKRILQFLGVTTSRPIYRGEKFVCLST